jgi:hypothetical protein
MKEIYIGVAVLVGLALIGLAIYFYYKKKSEEKSAPTKPKLYFKNVLKDKIRKENFDITEIEGEYFANLGKELCGKPWKKAYPILNIEKVNKDTNLEGGRPDELLLMVIFKNDKYDVQTKKDRLTTFALINMLNNPQNKMKLVTENDKDYIIAEGGVQIPDLFGKNKFTVEELQDGLYNMFLSVYDKDKFNEKIKKDFELEMKQYEEAIRRDPSNAFMKPLNLNIQEINELWNRISKNLDLIYKFGLVQLCIDNIA